MSFRDEVAGLVQETVTAIVPGIVSAAVAEALGQANLAVRSGTQETVHQSLTVKAAPTPKPKATKKAARKSNLVATDKGEGNGGKIGRFRLGHEYSNGYSESKLGLNEDEMFDLVIWGAEALGLTVDTDAEADDSDEE